MEARNEKARLGTFHIHRSSCKQWALLGAVVKRGPLSPCTAERIADLHRPCEAGLASVERTKVYAARLGTEVLWHRSLHQATDHFSSASIPRVSEAEADFTSSYYKEFVMQPSTKPISLSDIHDVYRGSVKKRDAAEVEQNYRKTDRFARDAGHSGTAPNRPPSPVGRRTR